jgi:DNA-binding beta-propeller fold protein YncE
MLSGVNNIAFSPDSAFAYASAGGTSAVLAFGRSSVTGALTPLAGTASCVSETGNAGTCADGVALIGATDVAVSPDGSSVYVTASSPSNAVAVFSRNVGTGVLSQLAGTAGCVSDDGTSAACVDGIALQGASAVAVNSDGTNVFIVGRFSDSLSVFHRDASTGALTQATGTAGCLSPTASGCTVIRALTSPNALAVSGEDVYVTSNSGVALFTGR